MKNLIMSSLSAAFIIISATTAEAAKVRTGTQESLTFVADTTIAGLSLCHRVEHISVQRIPLTSESLGYVLAGNKCDTDRFHPFTKADLFQAQADGTIAADVPLVPSISAGQLAVNVSIFGGFGLFIIGALLMPFSVFRRLFRRIERSNIVNNGIHGARNRKARKVSQRTATRMLAAMCYVAKADGKIEGDEVMKISHVMGSYAGHPVTVAQVVATLENIPDTIDTEELEGLGLKTKPADCEAILEAALVVAASDGHIDSAEYSMISAIAEALSIGADQFQSALSRVASHLQQQPA